MKKSFSQTLLIISIFLLITQSSFAQQQDVVKPAMTVEDYLKKSKRQKTTGWILTSAGVALSVVSFAELIGSGYNYTSDENDSDGSVTSALALASIGTGAYFFIASGKNKRRARNASVFIDVEKMPVLHHAVLSKASYPTVGLSISF